MSKFLFVFFSCLLFDTEAQDLYSINFNAEAGLPSSEIFDLATDNLNQLWIASDNGLILFNGYDFKKISNNTNKEECFISVLIDPQNRVWVQSLSGKLYIVDKDKLRLVRDIKSSTNKYLIFKPFMISNTELLFYNKSWYEIINTLTLESRFDTIINQTGIHLFNYNTKPSLTCNLSCYTNYNKFKYYKHSQGIDSQLIKKSITIKSNYIFAIDNDNIIIHGANSYLLINEKKKSIYRIPTINTITFVKKIKNDEIWVGTKGQGLLKFKSLDDLANFRYTQYFSTMSISNMLVDNMGGYWFSSLENGIYFCPNINLRNYKISDKENFINCATIDSKHNLYLGQSNNDISIFDGKALQKLTSYPYKDKLYDLYFDENSQKLLAGFEASYYKNKRWSYIDLKKNLLVKRFVNTNAGIAFCFFAGYYFFNPATNKITFPNPSFTERTFSMLEHNGTHYIGTINGLFYNINGKVEKYIAKNMKIDEEVKAIAKIDENNLMIGTVTNLYILNTENRKVSKINADSFGDIAVNAIYISDKNNYLIASQKGLLIIRKESLHYNMRLLNSLHGLQDNYVVKIFKVNSKLQVVTKKGITIFDSIPSIQPSQKPKIVATFVNGKNKQLNKLRYNENNIDIEILTINYLLRHRLQYRYRVNEESWKLSTERIIKLSSLNPDHYKIEIQSKNQDNLWSASTFINFKIDPPFTKTFAFYFLIAFIVFITTLLIGYKLYKRQLMYQKAEKKLLELEKSALQAQMNPHFIFNALASIQNFILTSDIENANKYLAQFSKLIRKILHQSKNSTITIEDELYIIENYIQIEKLRFEDRFQYRIKSDLNSDELKLKISQMLIQPFIENAINHGLNQVKEKGKLEIRLKIISNKLEVIIEDNGFGYDPNNKKNLGHKSTAIDTTNARLKLINSENKGVQIENILGLNGESIGTRVLLTIDIID